MILQDPLAIVLQGTELRRTRLLRAVGSIVCCVLTVPGFAGEPQKALMIENETLQVRLDTGDSSFSILHRARGSDVITAGKLAGQGGVADVAAAVHATFGGGQEIRISYPNGNRDSIALFSQLPFALFTTTLHNGDADPMVLNRVRTLSVAASLDTPITDLRAFGTAGLTAVDRNPGSYAYLAIVDPTTSAGIVGGWVTHDRGSGVVFSPIEHGSIRMDAQVDYGHLRIKPGQDARSETFALGWFGDVRLGLEAYADVIARVYSIKLPPQPAGYCTWYADQHGGAGDEQHLAELAAFAAEHLKPYGFEFIQIDDGWQDGISTNGPCRNFTTHRPNGPYSSGMQATATEISRLGLKPGIWFMPFAGTHYDPFFQDHQDWFAKGRDGKPFEATWGGTCLDMTHPGS